MRIGYLRLVPQENAGVEKCEQRVPILFSRLQCFFS